jgi:nicotinamidase-related amidase
MPSDSRKPTTPPVVDESLAVVVIDMQEEFLQQLAPTSMVRLIRAHKKFLLSCAESNVKVVVIEHTCTDQKTTPHLLPVLNRILRLRTIRKDRDDAFEGSGLPWLLEELAVTRLILTGINASSCVYDSAKSAINAKFNVTVVGELLADWEGYADYQKSRSLFRDMGVNYCSRLKLNKSAFSL